MTVVNLYTRMDIDCVSPGKSNTTIPGKTAIQEFVADLFMEILAKLGVSR